MSVTKALHALRRAAAKKVDDPAFTLAGPATFFALVRGITGGLTQTQVDTINAILAACKHWPLPWVAYALATAFHEARR